MQNGSPPLPCPRAGTLHDVFARAAVCLLDVPTHKTGTVFTTPVRSARFRPREPESRARPPSSGGRRDKSVGRVAYPPIGQGGCPNLLAIFVWQGRCRRDQCFAP